jgi:hypothetical protein
VVGEDKIPASTQGVGNELDRVGGYCDGGIAQGEEAVYAGARGSKEEADGPGADGGGGEAGIVCGADGGSDLFKFMLSQNCS